MALALSVLAVGAVAAPARAAQSTAPQMRLVSGAPYQNGTACQSVGKDREPSLGVDPNHPARMVAAWMQDIGPTHHNIVVSAASTDGGRSWGPTVAPPGVNLCAGFPGPGTETGDPSVSVGPDGRWYLAMITTPSFNVEPATLRPYVTTSLDGTHWQPPTQVVASVEDDFDTIVADSHRAGRAYLTWDAIPPGAVEIAVTNDGGRSFSTPTIAAQPPLGYLDDVARLAMLSDGSLLVVYSEQSYQVDISGVGDNVLLARRGIVASDGQIAWSDAVRVGDDPPAAVVDPHNASTVYDLGGTMALAAGPNGTAQVVWTTTRDAEHPAGSPGDVLVATGVPTPSGSTQWSAKPVDLPRTTQPFDASVAVAADGTIAATWYDFSGAQPATQTRPTTAWVARSSDAGASWSINELAGPFDIRTATGGFGAGPNEIGDFESLVPDDGGFEAAFTLASPFANHGPTDIFAAELTPEAPRASPPLPTVHRTGGVSSRSMGGWPQLPNTAAPSAPSAAGSIMAEGVIWLAVRRVRNRRMRSHWAHPAFASSPARARRGRDDSWLRGEHPLLPPSRSARNSSSQSSSGSFAFTG